MEDPKILVVGDEVLDIDHEFSTVREGPDYPIVQDNGSKSSMGGAGAVHRMVRGLDSKSILIGRNGCYPVARRTRYFVDGEVKFRGDSHILPDGETIRKCGKNVVNEIENVDDHWPDVIALADYRKGVISQGVMHWLRVQFPNVTIVVKPAYGEDPGLYEGADCVVVNDETYTSENWHSFQYVVHTKGPDGMAGYDHGQHSIHFFKAAASEDEIVDTHGAGEMAIAALSVMFAGGRRFDDAVRAANVAAGIECTKHGAVPIKLSELYY